MALLLRGLLRAVAKRHLLPCTVAIEEPAGEQQQWTKPSRRRPGKYSDPMNQQICMKLIQPEGLKF